MCSSVWVIPGVMALRRQLAVRINQLTQSLCVYSWETFYCNRWATLRPAGITHSKLVQIHPFSVFYFNEGDIITSHLTDVAFGDPPNDPPPHTGSITVWFSICIAITLAYICLYVLVISSSHVFSSLAVSDDFFSSRAEPRQARLPSPTSGRVVHSRVYE